MYKTRCEDKLQFAIENKDGSKSNYIIEQKRIKDIKRGPIEEKRTSITKQEKGNEFTFTDGLRAIKFRRINDARFVWDYAVVYSEAIVSKNKSACVELKLRFLRDAIDILIETQQVYFSKPDLLKDVTYLYWAIYLKNKEELDDYDLAVNICERYLDLLADDGNQDWFDRKNRSEGGRNLTRESEMKNLADELLRLRNNDQMPKGSSESSDTKKRIDQALNRAKEQLMRWYNIDKAIEISTALQNGRMRRVSRVISGWLPELVAAVLIGYLLLLISPQERYMLEWYPFGCDVLVLCLYVLMFLGALISVCKLRKEEKKVDFQIYLPRMAAGIIVGYLALLGDEAWGGIFGAYTSWAILGRVSIPIMAVFIYILIEMNNVKGIEYPILKKALRLFCRGASYTVLTAVVISDLFGKAIVKRIPETADLFARSNGHMPLHLRGLFGNIYPEVVFYLAPLGLFIGVFVQLLWEDKTLTSKI